MSHLSFIVGIHSSHNAMQRDTKNSQLEVWKGQVLGPCLFAGVSRICAVLCSPDL